MKYRKELTAAYADSDVSNLLKLSAILRYMQQTSSEHLISLEQSVEHLREKNIAFLFSKCNIKIHRNPVCSERLIIETAANFPVGARFIREYVIKNPEGERLVSCHSLWVLVDTVNHKILRPNAYPYTLPWSESSLKGILDDVTIPKDLPQNAQVRTMDQKILYSHLDFNSHANNSAYIDFVCDSLPYDEFVSRGISTLALSFQKEAKYGDIIKIQTMQLAPCAYKITGTNAETPCFEAYVELNEK